MNARGQRDRNARRRVAPVYFGSKQRNLCKHLIKKNEDFKAKEQGSFIALHRLSYATMAPL